jgi:uncharacterized membrane protein
MKRIPFSLAVKILLLLQAPVLIFHLLVITGIIPYNIVWGGRLHSTDEMRKFETMSILVNLFMASVIGIKGRYINTRIDTRIINAILWVFTILFALNTLGNLFAKATLETIVFTPLTFLSAVLCGRLALEKEPQ